MRALVNFDHPSYLSPRVRVRAGKGRQRIEGGIPRGSDKEMPVATLGLSGSSHPDCALRHQPSTGALGSQVPWGTFVARSSQNMVPFQTQVFYTPVVGL